MQELRESFDGQGVSMKPRRQDCYFCGAPVRQGAECNSPSCQTRKAREKAEEIEAAKQRHNTKALQWIDEAFGAPGKDKLCPF